MFQFYLLVKESHLFKNSFVFLLGEKGGWGHCNPSFVFFVKFCRWENYRVVHRVKLLEHKRMPLGKLFNFHDGNILKWELVK